MKTIITFFLLLFAAQSVLSQVDKIAKEVESIVLLRSQNDDHKNHIKNFFEHYNQAKPIGSEDLIRDYTGICIETFPEKKSLLFPAKYSVDFPSEDSRTSYFNLNPVETSISKNENSGEYLKLFLENSSKASKTDYFLSLKYVDSDKKGKAERMDDQLVIADDDFLSFLKIKDQKIYGISFSLMALKSKNLTESEIRMYIFDQNLISADDYMMIQLENSRKKKYNKTKVQRETYPLYHDYRVDELRTALRDLIGDAPYSSDQILIKYVSNLKNKLERTNIAGYAEELSYFAALKIDKKYKEGNEEAIVNINHTALHSLADISIGKKEYQQAEKYLLKALTEFPLYSLSGTTSEKDANRIEYDLAKVYQKLERKDEAYGYLLALINSQWYYSSAEKEITALLGSDDKNTLKKDIDKALKTFNVRPNYFQEFTFRGNKIVFWNGFPLDKKSFSENITETEFYKSLKS